jgi:hypothetical protein
MRRGRRRPATAHARTQPTPTTPLTQALAADYAARLGRALPSSAEIDALGFLRTDLRDWQGRRVVLVLARSFNPRACSADELHTYLVQNLDAVADQPYVVVWAHTRASYWANCPSLTWLFSTYQALPAKYRHNLQALHALHCDTSLWLGAWALLPLACPDLWAKLQWVRGAWGRRVPARCPARGQQRPTALRPLAPRPGAAPQPAPAALLRLSPYPARPAPPPPVAGQPGRVPVRRRAQAAAAGGAARVCAGA